MADIARKTYGWSARPNGGAEEAEVEGVERSRAVLLGAGRDPLSMEMGKGFGGTSLTEQLMSGMSMTGGESLKYPYEESKWVHACIRAQATSMLQAPIRFYTGDPLTARDDEDVQELPTNHELYKLFGMPSSQQTGNQFREANLVHRKLDGETIWFMMGAEGEPIAASDRTRMIDLPRTIIPVRGASVRIKKDKRGLPEFYVYPSKTPKDFPAHSVVHFRDYDPNSPLRGLGDVEVLMRDLAAEFQAQRYTEGLLGNGGDPGGWIVNKGPMSDAKRRGEEAAINDRYSNVERAGEWHVISGKDVNIVPNKMNPKDMEYIKLREYTFNAVCAVMGVPTILLGDSSSATYANFEQAMRQLWTGPNGIISYIRSEEDAFKHLFLDRLSLAGADRIWMRYDLGVVSELQEDSTDAVERATKLASSGVGISYNEAAATVGLGDSIIDGGNLRLVDNKFQTVESFETGPQEPDASKPVKVMAESVFPEDGEITDNEMLDAADELLIDRQAYVHRAVDVLAKIEKKQADTIRKYLRKYELAQIKRVEVFAKTGKTKHQQAERSFDIADLTANDLRRLLLDPEEWAGKLYGASAPMIEAAFDMAFTTLEAEIGVTGLTMSDPAVVAFLDKQGVSLANGVGGVNGTLSKKVEKALLRIFSEEAGTTVNSLQEAVRSTLPRLKGSLKKAFTDRDSRALTIAQTESAKASNGARYMTMKKSDVVENHEWVTAGDGEVRESHAAQNGDIVVLGKKFKNGLRWPNDPLGSAAEVVNCRCVAAPVIEDN